VEVWEQLDNENGRAFEAFLVYREMGLSRSLKKVANVIGRSRSWTERMASSNEWTLRARAYDREVDRIRLAANAEAQVEMILRHARLGQEVVALAHDALRRIDPESLKPGDVVRLLELGVKTERLSRGAPTEHVATSDGDPMFDEAHGEDLASEFQGYLAGLAASDDQSGDPEPTTTEGGSDAGQDG
jgi:hypothetical protein